jgi:type VII secretion-associated serine protease mycosin
MKLNTPGFRVSLTFISLTLITMLFAPLTTPSWAVSPPQNVFGSDLTATQWGITATRAAEAWKVTKGQGVIVAVIDTGVDATHPDLEGRVLAGYSTVYKQELPEGEQNDVYGHGTHVAAIIAGDDDNDGVVGIAPEATILPIQALGSGGSGDDRTVADAIDYAVRNGAHVINLSLGGEVSPFQNGGSVSCAAVEAAFSAGVVVVVSSGNAGGYGNPKNEPASCKGALSVAAVDETLNRTYFSSYDNTVRVSAPGRRIVSAIPTGPTLPYEQWDGTSMAAPHVAGVAALLRAAHPEWSALQVVDRILTTATDLGSLGPDTETGAGLVDAAAALGAPSRDVTAAREAVAFVSVPRVVRASTDNDTTTFDWEAPVGSKVDLYVATLHQDDGTTYDIELPSSSLSVTMDRSAFPSGTVSVTAITPQGQRRSFMFTSIDYSPRFEPSSPKIIINSVSARWVSKGIEVTFTTKGADGLIDITVLGPEDTLVADIEVLASKKKTIIPIRSDAEFRARNINIIAYADQGGSKLFSLDPQYQISAVAKNAGLNHRAVVGTTLTACFNAKKLACQGQIVEVREVKTNKLIATTRVLENLTYNATFRWVSAKPVNVKVIISKLTSQTVTLKATSKKPVTSGATPPIPSTSPVPVPVNTPSAPEGAN